MKIWLDGQCFQSASRNRGIGRYALEWIRASAKEGGNLVLSLNAALSPDFREIGAWLQAEVPPLDVRFWQGIAESGLAFSGETDRRLLSERLLDLHVQQIGPDIAISISPFEGMSDVAVPFFPGPAFERGSMAIIYDFIPLRLPGSYLRTKQDEQAYRNRMEKLVRFDHFLAISEFTAAETRELLRTSEVTNLSAGVSTGIAARAIRQGSAGASPFVICYVGALDPRKNVAICLEALDVLGDRLQREVRFEVHGAYSSADAAAFERRAQSLKRSKAKIVLGGAFQDVELPSVYARADVVVQPSLLEGFGLTALEAMASGTPILAARAGALPEVVGLEAALFDPHDPSDLARKIEALGRSPELWRDRAEYGLQRARQFTWQRSAEAGIAAAKRLLAHKTRKRSCDGEQDALLRAIMDVARQVSPESLARLLAVNAPVQVDRTEG